MDWEVDDGGIVMVADNLMFVSMAKDSFWSFLSSSSFFSSSSLVGSITVPLTIRMLVIRG